MEGPSKVELISHTVKFGVRPFFPPEYFIFFLLYGMWLGGNGDER